MKLKKTEQATFAAGCFWGVEELFRNVLGVKSTEVGYIGGWMKNPPYLAVCTSLTGHAEAVRIAFDPKEVSYSELLDIFWNSHDPSTRNRQGPDIGTQYRSEIFFHSKGQEKLARESKEKLEKSGRKIATEITPAKEFWKAEEYHQKYLMKKGAKSCSI